MSAHEVEQYAYCAQNWALAKGPDPNPYEDPQRRITGMFHEAERSRRRSFRGLRASFGVLLAAGAVGLVAAAIAFFQPSTAGYVYVALALVLANASAGLWTLAILAERKARKIADELGILSDAKDSQGEVLKDPDSALTGTVPYVLQAGSRTIPILVKGGKTPRAPYRSHRLHLAALLRLLREQGPEYGLITYPNGIFRQEADQDQEALDKLLAALEGGKTDRDHNSIARCRGCARRSLCTQRLA